MPEVRTITDEEVPAYIEARAIGFHHHPAPGEAEFHRPNLELDRTLAAFDGRDVVGTARSFAAEITVPGGAAVPVGAITNVTVTATHRRRGLLTEMMRQQLDVIAGRGEPAAILIASEAPIYGRYGFGPATEHARIEVDDARFTAPPEPGGTRLCTPEEARKEMPAIYERFRRSQPGAIDRSDWWWDVSLGILARPNPPKPDGEEFAVLRRDGSGIADGYARYRIKERWEHRAAASTIELDELVAASDEAYAALWRYCTSVDWIRRVAGDDRPVIEPLPSLVHDRRAVRQRFRSDFLWARLLDVPRALSTRSYGTDEPLVIEYGEGTVALDPRGNTTATTATPDLTVDVGDLGAAWLGGTPLWPAAAAGRVTEHRSGAVERFDRLFFTAQPPWCNTWF